MDPGELKLKLDVDTTQMEQSLLAAERRMKMFQAEMQSRAKAPRAMQAEMQAGQRELMLQSQATGKMSAQSFVRGFVRFGAGVIIANTVASGLQKNIDQFEEQGSVSARQFVINFGESIADTLKSIPIVSQVGQIIGLAIDEAFQISLRSRRKELTEFGKQMQKASARRAKHEKMIADEIERQNNVLKDAQRTVADMESRRQDELASRRASRALGFVGKAADESALEKEVKRAAKIIKETEQEQLEEAAKRHAREVEALQEQKGLSEKDLEARLMILRKEHEIARENIMRERQLREEGLIDLQGRKLEAFKREEEMRKREQERIAEKAKREAEKERKRIQELHAMKMRAEEEIREAREEAQQQAAGATATFSTAGGSFTTRIRATIDHNQVMRKISEQSREFLRQIMMNTAVGAGGISLR